MKDYKDYNEIIQLLIWAYKQGYLHASQVLKDTVPDDKQLQEMFKKSIEDKRSVENK